MLTLHSGPSRCFPFWQELLACYVVNTAKDDAAGAAKCAPALEDYYECLHHKKEVYSLPDPLDVDYNTRPGSLCITISNNYALARMEG